MTEMELAKIKRDPYYYPLYLKYGFEYIKEAGFFFDLVNDYGYEDFSLMMPCTPMNHVKSPTTTKHCVIVTSGVMCPPHDGHIEMMIAAKERLELAGYEVLGGYIAPDNDEYAYKKNGDYAIPIEERLYLTTKKIWQWSQQEWLSIDPWYGLFTPTSLNFTDLILRTKAYLKKYKDLDTEIFYVCGGDRHLFSHTFQEMDGCVVVSRPGAELSIVENAHTYIATMDNNCSSTELRNKLYYKFNRFTPVDNVKLRVDGTDYFSPLSKYYTNITDITLEHQKDILNAVDLTKVISLDPCLRGVNYMQVSRNFDLFGHNKNGYFLKDAELNLDKNEEYILFDDDIYSGGTMRFATEHLKSKGVTVRGYLTLSLFENNQEIQDNRDFVVFEEFGGLMVDINGKNVRVPYAYPFVDPMMRCSVGKPIELSIDVWKFNYERLLNSDKKLGDLGFDNVYELIGFSKEMLLRDICKYYLDALLSLNHLTFSEMLAFD